MDRFEQIWFAGNHADIGGGYPENKSRLSDISLKWMIEAASGRLGEEGLLFDHRSCSLSPRRTACSTTKRAALSFDSREDPTAILSQKPSYILLSSSGSICAGVLQYDVVAPYRPEALRGHHKFPGAYDKFPCRGKPARSGSRRHGTERDAAPQAEDKSFTTLEENAMDRIVSCTALLLLIIAAGIGTVIFAYQCVTWLHSGLWHPDAARPAIGLDPVRWFGLDRLAENI